MTVGESLAQVRDTVGLSVDEVSGRTGIRETVIRAIERDDFDALGGDLYVRGYLRAITAALGIDPQPLIREFDAGRAASGTPASAMPSLAAAGGSPAAELAAGAAPADTIPAGEDYSSPWWADDAVSDADPLPAGSADPSADGTAPWPSAPPPAQRDQPDASVPAGRVAGPGRLRPAGTAVARPPGAAATRARPAKRKRSRTGRRSRVRGWRWATTVAAFAAVVLAIVGIATSQIVSKLSSQGHARASATPAVQAAAAGRSPAASASPSSPAASQAAAATPTQKATTTQPPAVRLTIVRASAFGPDGVADGDNAQSAENVIIPGSSRPWLTDWYATATFGMLKTGTGLLLDMGRTVTVTSVQIRLGGIAGADLQVRAGNTASLSGSRVVASARDAAGTLTVRLQASARARYVIIWFTGLPPSGSGNYQATVYSVAVTGRP